MPNMTTTEGQIPVGYDPIAVRDLTVVEGDRDAPGKRNHPDPVVYVVDVLVGPTVYLWARSDEEAAEGAYQHLLMCNLDGPPVIRVRPTADFPLGDEVGTDPYRIRHNGDTWWTFAHSAIEAAERFLSAAVGCGLAGSLVVTVERAS